MQDELISIIVPVYKVEKYLKRCIESLINQKYKNIEIILIDDGSPDNSGTICEDYAKLDDRIIVIHKRNGGVSSARNAGLDIARGKYITFVDSDDIADIRQYETMYELIKNNGADAAFCELQRFFDGDNIEKEAVAIKVEKWSAEETFKNILMNKNVGNYVMTKMFKSELFDGLRFPEGKSYEDVATVYKVIARAQKVMYTNEKLYYYLVGREGSITSTFTEKKLRDSMDAYNAQYKFLKDRYPNIKDSICTEYAQSYTSACEKMCMNKFYDLFDSNEVLERYEDFCDAMNTVDKDFFKSNLTPYRVLSSIILNYDRNCYKGMFDEIYKLKK